MASAGLNHTRANPPGYAGGRAGELGKHARPRGRCRADRRLDHQCGWTGGTITGAGPSKVVARWRRDSPPGILAALAGGGARREEGGDAYEPWQHRGQEGVCGGKTGRPVSVAARGMLAVICIIALLGLAACGSATAGGAGHPASSGAGHTNEPAAVASASAGVPLCAAAGRVDRVVVSRVPALSASSREPLPGGITFSGASRVRALAAGLCALPLRPHGPLLSCPADFGGAVRLVFAAGRRGFPPVVVQGSGCRIVTGVGPARSWSRSPQLKRLLGKVTGGRMIPGPHPSSIPTA